MVKNIKGDYKMTDKNNFELVQAIGRIQRSIGVIEKTTDNKFFKTKYASLPDVYAKLLPFLEKEKIIILNSTSYEFEANWFITTAYHEPTKQQLSVIHSLNKNNQTPQQWGSDYTYARRYNLLNLFGLICADEDDDGNAASGKIEAPIKQSPPPKITKLPKKSAKEYMDLLYTMRLDSNYQPVLDAMQIDWPLFSKEEKLELKAAKEEFLNQPPF